MCLVAVAQCLLHACASLTWWRQKNPREYHPLCSGPASFSSSKPGPRASNLAAWNINSSKSLSEWFKMAVAYRDCKALTDIGREWRGLLGWLVQPLPNQHPNCFPDSFKLLLGWITSLQLPPLWALLSSLLIPLPNLKSAQLLSASSYLQCSCSHRIIE